MKKAKSPTTIRRPTAPPTAAPTIVDVLTEWDDDEDSGNVMDGVARL